MRLETDYNILLYMLIGLGLLIALSKTNFPTKPYKILLTLMLALTLPAFIPGHGETVMLIPNAALFMVASSEAKIVGGLFILINFTIIWFVLFKVFGLLKK